MTELVADGSFDAIINFAAESHVDRSITDATPFLRTNMLGTQCLLDAAREARRFPATFRFPPTRSTARSSPTIRRSPRHAAGTQQSLCRQQGWRRPPGPAAHHTFGIDTVITRCSNNYGPYQFPEKLIPLFITNVMADIPVPVYGDGRQVRDWIYVLDHCRGIDAALPARPRGRSL